MFDLGRVGGDGSDDVQHFSEIVYKDITLSLGTGKIADVIDGKLQPFHPHNTAFGFGLFSEGEQVIVI